MCDDVRCAAMCGVQCAVCGGEVAPWVVLVTHGKASSAYSTSSHTSSNLFIHLIFAFINNVSNRCKPLFCFAMCELFFFCGVEPVSAAFV